MAIQLDNRTKIIAGVAVLAIAGAGAWFFLFQDEPPPPPKVAAKAPAKAEPAKAPEALKPAAAAKAAAKPIPTDPDQVIAEIIETSGLRAHFRMFGREAMVNANAAGQAKEAGISPADARAILEIIERAFDPAKMTAEVAANLKSAYDADKMPRFLELLRQPISLKMTSQETRQVTPEAMKEYTDNFRKNPPSAARTKLIQDLDEVTRTSEIGAQIATATARDLIDELFGALQKAGKQVPKEARQAAGSQIIAMQDQMRSVFRTMLHVIYRDASDEELAQYLKLVDTETGRWGSLTLANALQPVMESRSRNFVKELVQVAMKQQVLAKAPAAPPVAKAPEEKPAAAAPAIAPAEPVGYQRPANIRELYSRYNDLITAVVMRDRVAVRELLADGKPPNVRQTDGSTPLMIAASYGDADVAQMLLAKGADPNLRAPGGATALSNAKAAGKPEMVRLLERHGARN